MSSTIFIPEADSSPIFMFVPSNIANASPTAPSTIYLPSIEFMITGRVEVIGFPVY